MDNNDFKNKENLGHGIKGDVSTDTKDLKNEKKKDNRLCSNKNSTNA